MLRDSDCPSTRQRKSFRGRESSPSPHFRTLSKSWRLIYSILMLCVKVRRQIVLDGPVGCGKSITLAMLVHLARHEGWLVLYVPQGQDFVLDTD
ncbi:hypothetical protein K2173_020323 [Erythroxylum novogranatense]|uniref:Small ribosomal subunit protein mS29 n=1 Tax=Erythroxylum novogranatense TaxID=1862640 RepID=A0AAV8UB52_9ROSI|nr:hypothetical protein K2173_020323 [Erythroxylum novogranatense]